MKILGVLVLLLGLNGCVVRSTEVVEYQQVSVTPAYSSFSVFEEPLDVTTSTTIEMY